MVVAAKGILEDFNGNIILMFIVQLIVTIKYLRDASQCGASILSRSRSPNSPFDL